MLATALVLLCVSTPLLQEAPHRTAGSGSPESLVGASSPTRRTNVNVTRAPGAQNEVSVAVSLTDPRNVVVAAHDYRNGFKHLGTWASRDGGLSFRGGLHEELGAYRYQGDGALATDRFGVFYLAYIDHDLSGPNRIAVARSFDGGSTWPEVTAVVDHPRDDGVFEDKPYLVVDDTGGPFDGTVYVTWVRVNEGVSRIMCARSLDGGRGFELPVRLDGRSPVTGPVPVVGPNGEVFVAWRAGLVLRFTASSDGGASFRIATNLDSALPPPDHIPGAAYRISPFPTLAVDRSGGPHHGTLYLAWATWLNGGQGSDIMLRHSEDGGTQWSPPVRVSDDTNESVQFMPWMCVGGDGVVSIVFNDLRESPGTARFHTYFARSLDGGHSFEPNIRLSDEETDTSLDDFFLGTFVGDYIGIAASPYAVYPAWTDLRPSVGQMEVFVRPMPVLGP